LLVEPVVAVGALGAATADDAEPIDDTAIAIAAQATVAASAAARSFRIGASLSIEYLQATGEGALSCEQ
jgi:hypothetical protein